MQSYLEIRVPVRMDSLWYSSLKRVLRDVPVRWQNGFYHITVAFLDETPVWVDLRPILDGHLKGAAAPVLTFDRLDAFKTQGGGFVIYLTASQVPESFLSLTKSIRDDMEKAGCVIQSAFKLHVTLGRVRRDAGIGLGGLKRLVASVSLPAMTMALTDVDLREFRGRTIYETKLK